MEKKGQRNFLAVRVFQLKITKWLLKRSVFELLFPLKLGGRRRKKETVLAHECD